MGFFLLLVYALVFELESAWVPSASSNTWPDTGNCILFVYWLANLFVFALFCFTIPEEESISCDNKWGKKEVWRQKLETHFCYGHPVCTEVGRERDRGREGER